MNTTPPCIGVTCGLRLESKTRRSAELHVPRRYVNALEDGGAVGVGLPVLSPDRDLSVLLERFDGFLFTGGADIPPDYYGAERHAKTEDLPRERVDFELELVRLAIEADKPVLAICYGHQLLNVALGGTLYQDIGDEIETDLPHRSTGEARAAQHEVTLQPGKLRDIVQGETHSVPSSHHQCVKEVAPSCEVTGHAPDGIIEAIEHRGKRFVVGVQWHPELARQDPWTRRLIDAFVAVCAE